MLIGVLGDIHSNIEALKAVWQELSGKGCDKFISTGDIVGYGASPSECIDFIREKEIESVRGNHDQYTTEEESDWKIQPYAREAILWTQDKLDRKDIDWLKNLPISRSFSGIQWTHASLEFDDGKQWPYVLNTNSALFHFFVQTEPFCFYGHTHIPLLFTLAERQISFEMLTSRCFPNLPDAKFLINPGSVGQPRDFDSRASAALFDLEDNSVTLLRVEYDIASAQKKILDAGLPKTLAERLESGK